MRLNPVEQGDMKSHLQMENEHTQRDWIKEKKKSKEEWKMK